MNAKLWSICSEMETAAINQDTCMDTFNYVLDGLDRSAAEATKGDQEAAKAFLSGFSYYSGMLYLLLGVMQDQIKESHSLLEKAWEEARA